MFMKRIQSDEENFRIIDLYFSIKNSEGNWGGGWDSLGLYL